MRAAAVTVVTTVLALLGAVPLATAFAPSTEIQSMSVLASTHTAGAHRVRITIRLTYDMQCGYPGAGALMVTFPAGTLPKRFAAGSVKLDKTATTATIKGRNASVTVPPPKGTLCGTIGPGLVTLTFTHAARVKNPSHAGSYRFTATHTKRVFTALLKIKAS